MHTRGWKGWVLLARWLLLAGTLATGCAPSGPSHIVVISVDSLRADRLGSYGHSRDTSPRIDRLAASGTLFEQAYSSTNWTLPAHASLFTGLAVPLHQVQNHDRALADELPTLAQRFSAEGWATGAVVSGPYLHPRYGLARGFDDYENCISYFDDSFRTEKGTEVNRASHEEMNGPCVVRRARSWLDAHRDESALLFLHLWDVHYDYVPPAPWESRFDPDYAGVVDGTRFARNPEIHPDMDSRDLEHLFALYDGEVGYTDSLIGQVLDHIEGLGLKHRTLVVVTSDHGDAFFEHGEKGHQKDLYSESLQIPLIFSGPGVPADTRRTGPASLVDVLPTLVELAGFEASADVGVGRGISLVEAMHDPEALAERWVFAEIRCCKRWISALVGGDQKIVHDRQADRTVVFDLAGDPGEKRPREPSREESGRISGTIWGLQRNARMLPKAPAIGGPGEESLEQLRALGYAE